MDAMTFIVASLSGGLPVPALRVQRRIVRDGHAPVRKPPRKKVYRRAPGVKPRRTPEQIAAIVAYRLAGASLADTAAKFGCDRHTVWLYVKWQGES